MSILLLAAAASAVTLPGISVPFAEDGNGRWKLPADLPPALVSAGLEPGWELVEVEGQPFDTALNVRRRVAVGPAREVQLGFKVSGAAGGTETILVAPRAKLVYAREVKVVPWPGSVQLPVGGWQTDWSGAPTVVDAQGAAWKLDPETGEVLLGAKSDERAEGAVPALFWELTSAGWVIDRGDSLDEIDARTARRTYEQAARLGHFEGRQGEFLVESKAMGVRVVSVEWPRDTPTLPSCRPWVPESCLTSGMEILASLADLPGAREEAGRQLSLACANGIHRACYEAVAVDDPTLAPQVAQCLEGSVGACNSVAEKRFQLQPESPDDLVIGLLEYSCELEGSGTLGERLRRVEDAGAGCMALSRAYDLRRLADQALLTLDQACVIGRADACDQASERRHQAFAARTVRECEDPKLPIAAACVELGHLLQSGGLPMTTLDEFGAFLRGCSLGDAEGCERLGDYVDRWGIDNMRVRESERELEAACGQGELRACLGAGHLFVRHDPRSEEYGDALRLFDKACDAGLAAGCIAGAEQRRIGTARRASAPDQVAMWTAACNVQSAEGCAGLGERRSRAKSSLPEAFAAWSRACELGDPHSCSDLGRLVERKHDPSWPDEQPAEAYLRRGCDNGDPEGCFWLADLDLPRRGEPPEAAYVLLDRSCEGEYGPGCARLADVHLDRQKSYDDEIAARHLDTACVNGHYESCRVLGSMYLRGKGVERDQLRARELLERFRFNAKRKHLRLGVQAGLPSVVGAEGELILPIPVGPALAVGAGYSYVPGGGAVMVLVEGDSQPDQSPDLTVVQLTGRLYPNGQARGLYGAVGVHQLAASGGSITGTRVRQGWSARLGLRDQSGNGFSGLELGIGQYGLLDLKDFDEDEKGRIPIILPTFSFAVGFALL